VAVSLVGGTAGSTITEDSRRQTFHSIGCTTESTITEDTRSRTFHSGDGTAESTITEDSRSQTFHSFGGTAESTITKDSRSQTFHSVGGTTGSTITEDSRGQTFHSVGGTTGSTTEDLRNQTFHFQNDKEDQVVSPIADGSIDSEVEHGTHTFNQDTASPTTFSGSKDKMLRDKGANFENASTTQHPNHASGEETDFRDESSMGHNASFISELQMKKKSDITRLQFVNDNIQNVFENYTFQGLENIGLNCSMINKVTFIFMTSSFC
jgi:hypothetical protein